jgi:hypothetical protein
MMISVSSILAWLNFLVGSNTTLKYMKHMHYEPIEYNMVV